MAEGKKKVGGAGLRGQSAGETKLCTVGKTGSGLTYNGYDVADLAESAFLKTAVTFRYELFNKNYISLISNVARVENDLLNEGEIFDNTKLGFAAGYSIESFLGPLEVKYTWSPDTGRNYWLFNVGFWF